MLVMTYLGYAHHSPTPEYVRREGGKEGGMEEGTEGGKKRRYYDIISIPPTWLTHSHQPLNPSLPPSLPPSGANIRMAFLAIAFVFLTHRFLYCRDLTHLTLPPSLSPPLPPFIFRGNIRMAFLAIAFVFLTHCFLHCRDSVLIRPHPGVWRVVHGIGMLYLMCLGVLLGG